MHLTDNLRLADIYGGVLSGLGSVLWYVRVPLQEAGYSAADHSEKIRDPGWHYSLYLRFQRTDHAGLLFHQ